MAELTQTSNVVVWDDILHDLGHGVDSKALMVSNRWSRWDSLMMDKLGMWNEVSRFVFATDTTDTHHNSNYWSNKTVTPKLCQIHDTLYANYMASMFPHKQWLSWEGDSEQDEDDKVEAIESYMQWVVAHNAFNEEMGKLVQDFILCGNIFATPNWVDERTSDNPSGYVGPAAQRISPYDIKFDVTAPSFKQAPKVVRSLKSLGQVKLLIEKMSGGDNEVSQKLWDTMAVLRGEAMKLQGDAIATMSSTGTGGTETTFRDELYQIAGFGSYFAYLESGTVELLTFYGDLYDKTTDTLETNRRIIVADRHIVISNEPIDTPDGLAPIYHSGWRKRPDNLIAMGPLENILGMQYRIDHLENLKADAFDMFVFPVLKISGDVPDFEWGPFEKIYVGDSGDISVLNTNIGQFLQADNQIAILEQKMEEMAGSPKEAAGIRSPGEKTAFEVQRLESAANRLFQNKIRQFETQVTEPLVNSMLGMARKNMTAQIVRSYDPELNISIFSSITNEDLTGSGTLKPVAARNFAEKALKVQTMNSFFSSQAGQDPEVLQHFSSKKLAKMWEDLLELEAENVVEPFVRITERAEAEQVKAAATQELQDEQGDVSNGRGQEDGALGDPAPRGSVAANAGAISKPPLG